METRRLISGDHSHPDQSNVTPTAPLAPLFDVKLLPAPQHAARHQALRDAWAPRIVDPRTIDVTPTEEHLL
jgi:hypothetical protein